MIAWTSDDQDRSGTGIYARLYEATGFAAGREFRVNTTTANDQNNVTIASTPDGGFVVVWVNSLSPSKTETDLRYQRYDAEGGPVGAESILAQGPAGVLTAPEVVVGDDGIVRVVWFDTIINSSVATVRVALSDAHIPGSARNDVLTGTAQGEALLGFAGDDYLAGQGGVDTLRGGPGDDLALGDAFALSYAPNKAAEIFRLYQTTLDRAPDAQGHAYWTEKLVNGDRSLNQIIEGFTQSREFVQRFGALDDTEFVKLMYANVLDRDFAAGEVSQAEIDGWLDALDRGSTFADVVRGFSQSRELTNKTAQAAAASVQGSDGAGWTDDVYRLYQATLDRAPDVTGLLSWSMELSQGTGLLDVIGGFTASREFSNIYGVVADDADFVKLLYNNVLGRDFSAGEVSQAEVTSWTSQLSENFARGDIVQGFSQSVEFQRQTQGVLRDWVRAQGTDDHLDGGAGVNTLAGGALADVFVFDQTDQGTVRVLDLESWDFVSFNGFGYDSATDALSHLNQLGVDVRSEDQGTLVTFDNVQASAITEDMILV